MRLLQVVRTVVRFGSEARHGLETCGSLSCIPSGPRKSASVCPAAEQCSAGRHYRHLSAWQSLVRVLQVVLNDMRLASRLRDEIGSQRAAAVLPAFGELQTAAKRSQIGVAKVRVHDL